MKVRIATTLDISGDALAEWREYFELYKHFGYLDKDTVFTTWLREEINSIAYDLARQTTYPEQNELKYMRERKQREEEEK